MRLEQVIFLFLIAHYLAKMEEASSSIAIVNYSPLAQRNLLIVLWCSSIIWIPSGFWCLLSAIVDAGRGRLESQIFYFGFFALAASIYLWIIYLSQKQLQIDSAGINFPLSMPRVNIFRRRFTWDEIVDISLEDGNVDALEKSNLRIQTVVRTFYIDLTQLKSEDKRLVVSTLSNYAGKKAERKLRLLRDLLEQRKLGNTDIIYSPQHRKLLNPEEVLLADKQLSLKYLTSYQKLGLMLCWLAFPFWGVVGLLGSMYIPVILLQTISKGGDILSVSYFFFCPLVFFIGLILTASFFDSALTVGESGISFPLYMAPFLRFRRERLWSEIGRLGFVQESNGSLEHGTIIFHLGSGEHVPLKLRNLKKSELEILLLSINIWGRSVEQDPEIRLLQENMSNRKLGINESSYTKMWEDEMDRRFSSTSFVPLQAGHSLKNGSLTVVKQLAFGGMSAVYLCQINKTDLVVLKEFVLPHLDSEIQEKARQMFAREALILMKLSHPRLAKIQDHFVEDGRTYLLLDYIPGTDLRQIVLQKGKQPEPTVISWVIQVAEILSYLHRQEPPVIHRDITPENILLTADERIMLIDFGAANEFVGTATGTLVGKESFISPEQFRGDTVAQSDVYSLGATMYYLLTGEDPQPLSQSFPKQKNSEISDWANELVADCTTFELSNRIPSVDHLLQRLSAHKPDISSPV